MDSTIIHDNIHKLIHKKCHPKRYISDTKYHLTLSIIFNVVFLKSSYISQGVHSWRFFCVFFWRKADRLAPKHMRRLTTWKVLCEVEGRFHNRESNHQPLPWDLSISPPSSNSLGVVMYQLYSKDLVQDFIELLDNHIFRPPISICHSPNSCQSKVRVP